MAHPKPNRPPTFFWQGWLVIVPVIALAAAGFVSVRQDKLMAEAEARERADRLAADLLAAIQQEFDALMVSNSPAFLALRAFPAEVKRFVDSGKVLEEASSGTDARAKDFPHTEPGMGQKIDDVSLTAAPTNNQGNGFAVPPGSKITFLHRYASSEPGPSDEPVLRHAEYTSWGRCQIAMINPEGKLIYPPPLPGVPLPQPLDALDLTAQQSNLWAEACFAEFLQQDYPKAAKVLDELVRTPLSRRFSALVLYHAGVVLQASGHPQQAADAFENLLDRASPDFLSEGGIPLRQLALLQLAPLYSGPARRRILGRLPDSGINSVEWSQLSLEAILHPSLLSAEFLEQMRQQSGVAPGTFAGWQKIWNSHQTSRAIFELLQERLRSANGSGRPDASQGFFQWLDENWLVCRVKLEGASELLVAQSQEHVSERLERMITGTFGVGRTTPRLELARTIPIGPRHRNTAPEDLAAIAGSPAGSKLLPAPNYFGVMVELCNRQVFALNPMGMPLSVHEHNRPRNAGDGEGYDLRVKVFLADAAGFYARQNTRAVIFGALVGISALTALLGFLAARRAFQRQLHLNEMKSNFVSSVSHELRAPIASVRLMAEGLERGTIREPQKQHEYFRFIVQECRRLSSLIENVLDFSRIEQGRKEYEFEPTDLVALAEQTVKLMETHAAEQQISITLRVIGEPAPANVDGKAIQQALVNLLDNAIKHSPKGGAISVGLEFPADSSGAIRLWVEDHGEGIPLAEHERIFERFYRLGSELRRETQGVGIGLSIVKHIVEAHGGKTIVRSAPGQGSRFTIELPGESTGEFPRPKAQ